MSIPDVRRTNPPPRGAIIAKFDRSSDQNNDLSFPQDVKIGSLELSRVPFFSLAGIQKDARVKGFDGVLPTGLFRRVFIDHADHFAVLEPR